MSLRKIVKENYSNCRYEGEMSGGKLNGKGIMYFDNGNRYEGDHKDDKRNGNGIFYFNSGNRYDGEWKDDKMNGRGIFYNNNGNRYDGEWKDDKASGKGILYFNNVNRYEGEWKDDKRNGKGIFYNNNGNRYDGEWKDDKTNGKGILYFNNGNRYDGEWKDDKANGKGIMYYPNGDRYKGTWKNHKREGVGIYYFSAGKRELRQYQNGELISSEPLNLVISQTLPQNETFSRFAFLVGQNDGELVCCVNDATKMSQKLEKDFGYNCTLKTNLRLNEFESSFKSFLKTIEEDISSPKNTLKRIFFYFSGHGYEEDGKLFLMCKGRRHMKLDKLLRSLNQLKSQVHVTVIVDACRDDETNETWKPGGDGNSMTPPQVSSFQKSFILGFACASGKRSEASKNPRGTSLFTSELLSSMNSKKFETIMEILSSAGDRLNSLNQVRGKKDGHQQAWVNTTLKMETLKMKL